MAEQPSTSGHSNAKEKAKNKRKLYVVFLPGSTYFSIFTETLHNFCKEDTFH